MQRKPVVQHIVFAVFALLIVLFFVWVCTNDIEFRKYSLRFLFSHPFIVGFVLLGASVIHIVAHLRVKDEDEYGRDYAKNYIGFLCLIISLGFLVYGYLKNLR